MTYDIGAVAITGVLWLVGLTTYFVRISMKLSTLERDHEECRSYRQNSENNIDSNLTTVKEDMATIKNDLKWLKKQNGFKEDK